MAARSRALLFLVAPLLAACAGGTTSSTGQPDPTTGMTLTVQYTDHLVNISISGATVATSRKFGPYVVAATKLQPGDTVGLTFDAADAGMTMICGDGRDKDGKMAAMACGMFPVRAAEVTTGTLTLATVDTTHD